MVRALFSESTALIEHGSRRLIRNGIWRTALGGLLVVAVTLALGTRIYNGLSLPLLADAFTGEVPGSEPDGDKV